MSIREKVKNVYSMVKFCSDVNDSIVSGIRANEIIVDEQIKLPEIDSVGKLLDNIPDDKETLDIVDQIFNLYESRIIEKIHEADELNFDEKQREPIFILLLKDIDIEAATLVLENYYSADSKETQTNTDKQAQVKEGQDRLGFSPYHPDYHGIGCDISRWIYANDREAVDYETALAIGKNVTVGKSDKSISYSITRSMVDRPYAYRRWVTIELLHDETGRTKRKDGKKLVITPAWITAGLDGPQGTELPLDMVASDADIKARVGS